jgi:phosphatidylglycerol:prolipoprotein diacylglycerol transferase
MTFAVLQYPKIDPYIFRIGDVGLSWYAFNYIFAILVGYFIVRHRYRRGQVYFEKPEDIAMGATYLFYGLILGGRLFYVLFYNLRFYLENPLEIPAIWHGGMSFHGGLAGAILALWLFCRKYNARFLQILDAVSLCVPIGLGLGRLTNFINGELYGRVSHAPWAMVFPAGGPEPRHPSQLYEAILEGPVLFLIMWLVSRSRPRDGVVTAAGLIAYGVLRFIVEFFREPDPQLGTVLGPFSMGQLLCFLMVLAGVGFWIYLGGKKKPPA